MRAAIIPFLEDSFGNPSSAHLFGAPCKAALEEARRNVAELLNCEATEVCACVRVCVRVSPPMVLSYRRSG